MVRDEIPKEENDDITPAENAKFRRIVEIQVAAWLKEYDLNLLQRALALAAATESAPDIKSVEDFALVLYEGLGFQKVCCELNEEDLVDYFLCWRVRSEDNEDPYAFLLKLYNGKVQLITDALLYYQKEDRDFNREWAGMFGLSSDPEDSSTLFKFDVNEPKRSKSDDTDEGTIEP